MLKSYFKIDFSTVAIGCLLLLAGCNSGSADTMPAMNDNSAPTSKMMVAEKNATAIVPAINSTEKLNIEATDDASSKTATIVTIENMKFNPATITLNKGEKVTFINKDIVAHNATETKNSWASPMLANGQSWTFAPEKTSNYYCTVHVVMKGKIIVK
ncbi:plastocyanin/azurin family copper-binding protein [Kaistella antarctica]|uniref:Amicyanin n=1 Tax=Kaistella antarctica TaxID=266748 RepID=A0A3S5EUR6_9FLAO|nr:plastocyanin/azurin family copper-binding protein [Kaistella antarctica]SEW12241.1 Plastocyanin [Kaistella antarctica]VEH98995.1 Amicyanin precursor [Kaistella antarctica]